MLSAVLSKKTCAECRFCCSFRRKSLWETPLLSEGFMTKYTKGVDGKDVKYKLYEHKSKDGSRIIYGQTDLSHLYKSDDPEEEVSCPFLDTDIGCTLPKDDKPFDCKIWPLRYVHMPDNSLKVCLTPTCPAINKIDLSVMEGLVRDGLGDKIREYAKDRPYIVKEYKEGFFSLQ